MTAAQRVLATPELVDLTLCYLTPATLFRSAVKVCMVWNHVIENPSKRLSVALFLRQDTAQAREKVELGDEEGVVFNELLSGWINKWQVIDGQSQIDSFAVDKLPWRKHPEAWKAGEAKWRNILISHPPIPRISVTKYSVRLKQLPCETGVQGFLNISEGLRLGLLVDLIEDWYILIKHPEFDSKIRRERVGTGWCREFGALRVWDLRTFKITAMGKETVDVDAKWGKCFLRVVFENKEDEEEEKKEQKQKENAEVAKRNKRGKRVLGWFRGKLDL
ncbi:uncharacterized protein PAC_10478 [Phialocephala subalpina]|uniref:F-box domain-containing protein n=1 Tax=Phialocephala subalpina TaxID=576137 RepID=A0A1L7X6F3_9HELO|nr:uncharacterized protein PAC_10478 [Phialocephala subalpina]